MYSSKMTFRINIFLLVGVTLLSIVYSRTLHPNHSLGIIGGRQTDDNEAKYTVFIQPYIVDPVTHKVAYKRCGGSRLSEEYVLTAKHCLAGKDGVDILFGNHHFKKNSPNQVYFRIDKSNFIQHMTADIGLIKTPPVHSTIAIESVTLPLRLNAFDLYEKETGVAYGWGNLNNGQLARDLMEVDVTVISNSECDVALTKLHLRKTYCYEVCTSGERLSDPKGTCDGDSGSPFMIGNVQVGIVSAGPENCTTGDPSVYVRTGYFLDWIELQTGIVLP